MTRKEAALNITDTMGQEPRIQPHVSHAHFGIAATSNRQAEDYRQESLLIASLKEFKTLDSRYQFAINYSDTSLENRLRHCERVSESAIIIAKRLGLSDASAQLAGAIGMAHDIGHIPFSHWGEKAINSLLEETDRKWSHDTFALSILLGSSETLGADLSLETIEGVAKRFWRFDPSSEVSRSNHAIRDLPEQILQMPDAAKSKLHLDRFNHLEGQIAAQADLVCFNATDVQDGLRVGRFTPNDLKEHFSVAHQVYQELLNALINHYRSQSDRYIPSEVVERAIVNNQDLHEIIFKDLAKHLSERLISDLVNNTANNLSAGIENRLFRDAQDIRKHTSLTADFSPEIERQMRTFQTFCRKHVYPQKTAPFEPIVDAVIRNLLIGDIPMPRQYANKLAEQVSSTGKIHIVAEYLTQEVGDRELLVLAQQYAPETYHRHFPGYEFVLGKELSLQKAIELINQIVFPQSRLGNSIGMPIIHASEIDFRPERSIPVVSSTRKYVLPIPDAGETIHVPRTGKRRSGELYQIGEPILDWRQNPVSGTGVVFYNRDDDQWVAAKCGFDGDSRRVFIVNEVNEVQARLLDTQRSGWMDPNKPTLDEIKNLLVFASEMHLIEGLSASQAELLMNFIDDCINCSRTIEQIALQAPDFLIANDIIKSSAEWQVAKFTETLHLFMQDSSLSRRVILAALNGAYGGLNNIYPSDLAYVKKSLPGIPGYFDGTSSPYGYRMRDRSEIFRAVYIPYPFEFAAWDGNPERSYTGAVVIQRHPGVGICQNFRAIRSYEHPDGRPLKIEEIPIHRPSNISRYQTNHNVQRDVTTTVTVIGAGVSGIAAAVHLIKNFPTERLVSHKLTINLIESSLEPAGSTYNRPDANIVGMANSIGVLGIDREKGCLDYFNQDPERWIRKFPALKEHFDPTTKRFSSQLIITHNQYGEFVKEYFADILRQIEREKMPIEVNFIQDRVISTEGRRVELKSGGQLDSDALVYCVGNALPKPIRCDQSSDRLLDGRNGYHRLDDQAWSLGNINEAESTVILGTANGALFGALWAIGNGYDGKFTMISNSGAVPNRAGVSRPYDRHYLTPHYLQGLIKNGQELTSEGIKFLFLRELAHAKKNGFEWRDVVDSLAPDTNAIWGLLSDKEQKAFQSKYMSLWNNARYRIPDHHWSEIQRLQQDGRLEIIGGSYTIEPKDKGGFEVRITRPDGNVKIINTKKIVNNTGPSKRFEEMPDCIRGLISKGGARLHHIAGLDVDRQFRLKSNSGEIQDGVYAIGPIVKGAHPEAITVPAIREAASVLAHSIIEREMQNKEDAYCSQLAALAGQFERPSGDEIKNYVANMINQGSSKDPRNPNISNIISTSKIYFKQHGPHGTIYSTEREKTHKEIIDRALADKVPVPADELPSFLSVSGGMSVGMTYLQRLLIAEGVVDPKHTVIITPLSFKGIHEFDVRDHYQHTEKSPLMCEEYYDIVRKIVAQAIENRLNVMWVDQADATEPLMSLLNLARTKNYESAMLALTMTPEAYHAASELWLHKFSRIPDHFRGFGDLKEFADNWPTFAKHFDQVELYETYFHTTDIDKPTEDPTRREYTVKQIASVHRGPDGNTKQVIMEPMRYFDFLDRGRFINPESTCPSEARRDFPYHDFRQLDAESSPKSDQNTGPSGLEPSELYRKLQVFKGSDFTQKFISLVTKTSQARAKRAKEH